MTDYDLRCCDAFDLLASLADGSVDLTVTDPPYGTTAHSWDVAPDWGRLMAELLRVTRGVTCVFSQMPVAVDLVNAARDAFRYQIVWRKTKSQGYLDANRRPLRAHEVILVFREKGYGEFHPQMREGFEPYFLPHGADRSAAYGHHGAHLSESDGSRYPIDVIDFANVDSGAGGHPTRKPTDLLRWLVRSYSSEGALVLDPFAGSGSLGEACALERRRFVGSELDETFHAMAAERIRLAYAQGTFF